MNKIFKLLAVLMFFSALWAGNMTVHAETGVAQIVGGDTYASLGAAIEEAGTHESAVEIDLLADTALTSAVTINDNVTLDLNGKTLNLGSYDLSLSTSGKVIDSVGGGLLTTSGGKFNSTTQMAVYDTTNSGYVVADVKHQEKILSEASTGTFTLVFKPDFGETANSLLGSSGTDAKVSIQILLSWDGGSQTFTYDSNECDMIKDVYANNGKAFYITVTNFENVSNVKVTPLIVPSLGTECRGTEHTLTGSVAPNGYVKTEYIDKTGMYGTYLTGVTMSDTVVMDTALRVEKNDAATTLFVGGKAVTPFIGSGKLGLIKNKSVDLPANQWTKVRIVWNLASDENNLTLYVYNEETEKYVENGVVTKDTETVPSDIRFQTSDALHLDDYAVYTTSDTDYTQKALTPDTEFYKQDFDGECQHGTTCPALENKTMLQKSRYATHKSE